MNSSDRRGRVHADSAGLQHQSCRLEAELYEVRDKLNEAKSSLAQLNAQIVAEQEKSKLEIEKLNKKLKIFRDITKQHLSDSEKIISEMKLFKSSRSWRLAQAIRRAVSLGQKIRATPARRIAGAVYHYSKSILSRRSFLADRPALDSSTSIRTDSAIPPDNCKYSALIVAPPHVIHYATILRSELKNLGIAASIEYDLNKARNYKEIFLFCPNAFSEIPDGCIVFQMEQSVSSRWFTAEYINKLLKARAVIDYSIENIEFLQDLGVPMRNIFYVPVPARVEGAVSFSAPTGEDSHADLLFYGDPNSARRKQILQFLENRFRLKIVNNIFGPELWAELCGAKAVVNLHYYEDSVLETTRLSECMSFGVPVISEDVLNKDLCREFAGGVAFVEAGNAEALAGEIVRVLQDESSRSSMQHAARAISEDRHQKFTRYMRRALYALDMIEMDAAFSLFSLPQRNGNFCLTLSETPARRRIFDLSRRREFAFVDGFRHQLGWKGCALSYKAIMRKAIEMGLDEILVCEDDVSFPVDYDERLGVVREYLGRHAGQWDIFSGFIADVSPESVVARVEIFKGVEFIWLDRCVSTVYNIYSRKAMTILSGWDPNNSDVNNNTIDRYLQRHRISVVLARPFLVAHEEAASSTIWGIQNSQYDEMVDRSKATLSSLVENYMKKKG